MNRQTAKKLASKMKALAVERSASLCWASERGLKDAAKVLRKERDDLVEVSVELLRLANAPRKRNKVVK